MGRPRKKIQRFSKDCECGCGAQILNPDKQGRVVPFKYGRRGELSYAWKGGRYIDSKGYVRIYKPNHHRSYDRHVFEHVVKYEEYHNCCLLPWNVIHHRNGNKQNNSIEVCVTHKRTLKTNKEDDLS